MISFVIHYKNNGDHHKEMPCLDHHTHSEYNLHSPLTLKKPYFLLLANAHYIIFHDFGKFSFNTSIFFHLHYLFFDSFIGIRSSTFSFPDLNLLESHFRNLKKLLHILTIQKIHTLHRRSVRV